MYNVKERCDFILLYVTLQFFYHHLLKRLGNGNPLQHSWLGNPMNRGALQATIHEVARVGCDLATKQNSFLISSYTVDPWTMVGVRTRGTVKNPYKLHSRFNQPQIEYWYEKLILWIFFSLSSTFVWHCIKQFSHICPLFSFISDALNVY